MPSHGSTYCTPYRVPEKRPGSSDGTAGSFGYAPHAHALESLCRKASPAAFGMLSWPAMSVTDPNPQSLPDFTVRTNARAKHVRLRLTLEEGLVVVVPKGFNRAGIPAIVRSKQSWIRRTTERLQAQQAERPGSRDSLPERIVLPAIGRTMALEYRRTAGGTVSTREHERGRIVVSGPCGRVAEVQAALRRRFVQIAKRELEPLVWELAQAHRFVVRRVGVRTQRTRWASCSGRGTVTLNAKLLFLPPGLVRHVILHELCHTVHLNHSSRFWRLLAHYDPEYRTNDRNLRSAGRYVPAWF